MSVKTYMILQGQNNNNADVVEYHNTLKDAKEHLLSIKDRKDVFILMLEGFQFGEGFHKYTLELIDGKFKRNTRI